MEIIEENKYKIDNTGTGKYSEIHTIIVDDFCNKIVNYTKQNNYDYVVYLFNLLQKIDVDRLEKESICLMIIKGLFLACSFENLDMIKFYVYLIKENEWDITDVF